MLRNCKYASVTIIVSKEQQRFIHMLFLKIKQRLKFLALVFLIISSLELIILFIPGKLMVLALKIPAILLRQGKHNKASPYSLGV